MKTLLVIGLAVAVVVTTFARLGSVAYACDLNCLNDQRQQLAKDALNKFSDGYTQNPSVVEGYKGALDVHLALGPEGFDEARAALDQVSTGTPADSVRAAVIEQAILNAVRDSDAALTAALSAPIVSAYHRGLSPEQIRAIYDRMKLAVAATSNAGMLAALIAVLLSSPQAKSEPAYVFKLVAAVLGYGVSTIYYVLALLEDLHRYGGQLMRDSLIQIQADQCVDRCGGDR